MLLQNYKTHQFFLHFLIDHHKIITKLFMIWVSFIQDFSTHPISNAHFPPPMTSNTPLTCLTYWSLLYSNCPLYLSIVGSFQSFTSPSGLFSLAFDIRLRIYMYFLNSINECNNYVSVPLDWKYEGKSFIKI